MIDKIVKYIKHPSNFVIFLQNRCNFRVLSDKTYLKICYKLALEKELDLENPKTFNEKLQWLKLYDRKPEYTRMVDKYEAKKYVAEKIGEEYIIPTLGVWDHFDEIDFDSLPDQFVLKCTHDSGGLVIVKDKSKLDKEAAKKKIEKCLKINYFYSGREWPYKNVKPRILAEQYLENNEEGLHDYKIWCFSGKPYYVQYISGRLGTITQEAFYDMDWNKQPFWFHNPLMETELEKISCLEKIERLAAALADNTGFARCDFYILETGQIKFGEITFYPMSGMGQWHPEEMDLLLGEQIKLDNCVKK